MAPCTAANVASWRHDQSFDARVLKRLVWPLVLAYALVFPDPGDRNGTLCYIAVSIELMHPSEAGLQVLWKLLLTSKLCSIIRILLIFLSAFEYWYENREDRFLPAERRALLLP